MSSPVRKLSNREKLMAKYGLGTPPSARQTTIPISATPLPHKPPSKGIKPVPLPDPNNIPLDRQSFFCLVTPEWMRAILEKGAINRGLTDKRVEAYAQDMRNGKWHDLGDPIRFDWNGDFRDGQHRGWASIVSGTPFLVKIETGLDPASFDKMDGGKPRSPADDLLVGGHLPDGKYGNATAAALRLLLRWEWETMDDAKNRDYNITREQVREAIQRHPDIVKSSHFASGGGRLYSPGMSVFLHYILACVDRPKADEFFERLTDGVGLTADNPILILRNRLIKNKGDKRTALSYAYLMAITVKSWNAWRSGRATPHRLLRWEPESGMPVPV